MPMIALTLPAGVLEESSRRELQNALPQTLLKWEGAPDTEFFRALSWCHVQEVPGDRFTALGDGAPRFRVDVTVPQGALSQRRTEGLIREVTNQVLTAAGLSADEALRVWVLVHEQPEGTWGAGGNVVRHAELTAIAASARAAAAT